MTIAMTIIRPIDLIDKYYADLSEARLILLGHSRLVTKRALKIGRFLKQKVPVDLQFLAEAAMLHDIGMLLTNTPDLACHGSAPYLQHGILGRQILEQEGLPRHALVCERHIGIGLSAQEISEQELPLPAREMRPISLEEQIICYADLYYSKGSNNRDKEKTPAQVRKALQRFGEEKPLVFDSWLRQFEPELQG